MTERLLASQAHLEMPINTRVRVNLKSVVPGLEETYPGTVRGVSVSSTFNIRHVRLDPIPEEDRAALPEKARQILLGGKGEMLTVSLELLEQEPTEFSVPV